MSCAVTEPGASGATAPFVQTAQTSTRGLGVQLHDVCSDYMYSKCTPDLGHLQVQLT